jgi:hypothetical protein
LNGAPSAFCRLFDKLASLLADEPPPPVDAAVVAVVAFGLDAPMVVADGLVDDPHAASASANTPMADNAVLLLGAILIGRGIGDLFSHGPLRSWDR